MVSPHCPGNPQRASRRLIAEVAPEPEKITEHSSPALTSEAMKARAS